VDEPLDLFELTQDRLAQLNLGTEDEPRLFGQKNAAKLVAAVERARRLPLSRWLFALGIINIGEVTAHEIARLHKDLADVAQSPILKEIVTMEHYRQAIKNTRAAEKSQLPKTKTSQQKRDEEAYSRSLLALKGELDERAKGSPKLKTQLDSERAKLEGRRLNLQQEEQQIEAAIENSEQEDTKKELRTKLSKLRSTLKRVEPQMLKVGIHEAIGPVVADSVLKFFDSDVGKRLLERLESMRIWPCGGLCEEILDSDSGSFSEKIFVLTGTLTSMTRDEAAEEIRKRGGKVTNSVSKTTTFLIVGENAGATKSEQARKLGVEEVNEQQFITMLGLKQDNKYGNQQRLL
jgi:DNA ligase (NAD+)